MVYSVESYRALLIEAGILTEAYISDGAQAVNNVTYSSKEVSSGTLFVCKGVKFKTQYLTDAIAGGAIAYVSEQRYDTPKNVSYFLVSDMVKAIAIIADMYYESAYKSLRLCGITGTKGKTTTAYYLKYILDEWAQSRMEKPCGLLSSVKVYDGACTKKADFSTPLPFELHRHFKNAVDSGLDSMVMEVSSQALKYGRVMGVEFDVGIFLNIGLDHISATEHTDFDDYIGAKLRLFDQCETAIVNLGSDHIDRVLMAAKRSKRVITFGLNDRADVRGYDVRKQDRATYFRVATRFFGEPIDEEFCLTMPGLFNVENALSAITTALCFDIPIEHIKNGLRKAKADGRLEIYESAGAELVAIVDYAHNEMSFEKVFETMRAEFPDRTMIALFGSTGDKALNRRSELGRIASEYAQKIYLTADDPGSERVTDICQEMSHYVTCGYEIIEDREQAVRKAVLDAPKNSLLLLLGKGCETTQKAGEMVINIKSDAESVQAAFLERESYVVF